MKKLVYLSVLLSVSFSGFAQKAKNNENIYINVLDDFRYTMGVTGYIGPTATDTVYSDGKIRAIGPVALEKDGKLSEMKAGEWTEFYPNGQVRSKGAYEMDSYIQCCYIGPCRQYRYYKTGQWAYYYDNGQVKAEGRYQLGKLKVQTSCEGGAEIRTALTDKSWAYYNEKGERIELIDLEH